MCYCVTGVPGLPALPLRGEHGRLSAARRRAWQTTEEPGDEGSRYHTLTNIHIPEGL